MFLGKLIFVFERSILGAKREDPAWWLSEARAEQNFGDIIVYKSVNVDDGGGVAELNTDEENEEEGDDR